MPVSGLVLTLSDDPPRRDAALRAIRSHSAIEIGPRQETRLPIVVETRSREDDQDVWDWLHALPGVLFIDLVCTDWSQDSAENHQYPAVSPADAEQSRTA